MIVHVVTQREHGGAQAIALDVSDGMRAAGTPAAVLFLYAKEHAFRDVPGTYDLFRSRPGVVGAVVLPLRIGRFLRRLHADAVITHTRLANVIVQPIAALLGIRRRVAVHHSPRATYGRLVRAFDRVLGSIGIYSTAVFVTKDLLREAELPRCYRARSVVIENGVAMASSTVARDPGLLVAVGRLASEKDHLTFLRSLALVGDRSIRAVIVGDGPLRTTLDKEVRRLSLGGAVELAGTIERTAVHRLLERAELFVFTSRWEGMPIVLLEALAAGVPIVATDISACREVLGDAARYFPPGDVARLAEVLEELRADEAARRRLAEAAERRSRAFSVETTVTRYLEVIG